MALAEEVLRQPSIIGFVVRLLGVTHMQVYNENEQTEQRKIQNVQFEEREHQEV